ncbi:hypothetical protein BV22DRAFT_409649 [Leucogyrophana mollusca]|uniref:Uncharacterized protein n=1 Tax=Leucogyrophana mollusca TaxID=85980 RepID=A0ACB8BJY7_9AGAM|nr:hypothetical protein BV22DRAFT_409649 [Leucogyrophana mollusca]
MQEPEREFPRVLSLLTSSQSPDLLHQAVHRFYHSDASLSHPLCLVQPGSQSRDRIERVYQCYRILGLRTEARLNAMFYDKEGRVLFSDVTQTFAPRPSLFKAPFRLIARLVFEENESDGLFYIKEHEDWFHPMDLSNFLLPPLTPIVRLLLLVFTAIENACARAYLSLSLLRLALFGQGSNVQRGLARVRRSTPTSSNSHYPSPAVQFTVCSLVHRPWSNPRFTIHSPQSAIVFLAVIHICHQCIRILQAPSSTHSCFHVQVQFKL